MKAVEPTKAKDIDAESMASQATFSSTVSLLKNSMKSKFARKDTEAEKKSSSRKSLPKDIKTRKFLPPPDTAGESSLTVWPQIRSLGKLEADGFHAARQRTAEAYMFVAQYK